KRLLLALAGVVLVGGLAGGYFGFIHKPTASIPSEPPPPPPPPPVNFGQLLAEARSHFQNWAAPGEIDAGLSALDGLLAQNPPADIKATADALQAAWRQAKADQLDPDPSDPDRARFTENAGRAAWPGLDTDDAAALHGCYADLSAVTPFRPVLTK